MLLLEESLPSFKWLILDEGNKIGLQIDFHDGSMSEIAMLDFVSDVDGLGPLLSEDIDAKSCLMNGHFRDESTVQVSVSGCPGETTFQVKTSSK